MRAAAVVVTLLCAVSCVAPLPAGAQRVLDDEAAIGGALSTLRLALGHWSYGRDWSLWEMGTRTSQVEVSRERFSEAMQLSRTRPVSGDPVEAIEPRVVNPTTVVFVTRLRLETPREPRPSEQPVWFTLVHEDGDWRISLHTFLSIARWSTPRPHWPY
jgi:hypothetical protein